MNQHSDDVKAAGYRVAIVDDMPDNLQVLGKLLVNRGIDVMFASGGQEALDTIGFQKPDLVLLDIAMPDLDGYEVCRRLKADAATAAIPVIFLTAHTHKESVVKGFEAGGVDYITKPFNTQELTSRVFTHLELKRSRDTIWRQNGELSKLVAARDRFFSIIAHDLRSPFGVFVNMTKLLADADSPVPEKDRAECLTMMHDSAERMLSLLDNLLTWARTQREGVTPRIAGVELAAVVGEIAELNGPQAAAKRITLSSDVGRDHRVLADPEMIRFVVRNVVSNALKFTGAGGTVTLTSKKNGDRIELSCGDTGVGMSEAAVRKLFRIDGVISSEGTAGERGSGLGLVLCKEFADAMAATIEVHSAPGQGTTVRIALPAA